MSGGAGDRNCAATSGRETLANSRVRRTIRPSASRLEPRGRAAHHGRREAHERRRRDAGNAAPQQQLGDALLERGLVRRVDEVHAPVAPYPRARVASSSTARSTSGNPRPAAPKKPSIPARAIAITIRVVAMPFAISPGDVREAHAVHLAEGAVAQPLRVQRRQCSDNLARGPVPHHQAQLLTGGIGDDVHMFPNLPNTGRDLLGGEDRRRCDDSVRTSQDRQGRAPSG